MSDVQTCWDLLRGAAEGRALERERFCLTYGPVIRDFLGRRWGRGAYAQEIEDAEQETLIECLRERGALERAIGTVEKSFRALLFGVTRNVARRFEERRAKIARREAPAKTGHEGEPDPSADPQRDFDRAWATNVVRRAREDLEARAEGAGGAAARRCDVLRMRFFEDLPIRAIADRLEEDPARIHHDYAKARSEFREALLRIVRFESAVEDFDPEAEIRFLMTSLT